MSTVSHWDWIRHPRLTLHIHTRPRSLPFVPSSMPFAHTHASSLTSSTKRYECTNIHLPPLPILWCSPTWRLVNLKCWFEGQRAAGLWEILQHSLTKITTPFPKICHMLGLRHRDIRGMRIEGMLTQHHLWKVLACHVQSRDCMVLGVAAVLIQLCDGAPWEAETSMKRWN